MQLIMDYEAASKDAFDFATTYFDSLAANGDYTSASSVQNYQQVLAKEQTANTLFQALSTANESMMLAKRDSAETWNQSLIATNDYEEMEKTINEIYLTTLAIGIFEFSPSQMSRITQIAFQCPLKSASAVFRAREMYAIDNPLTNFDNFQLCAEQGIQYRYGNNKDANIEVTQKANQLHIELQGSEGIVTFMIYNSLGQLMHQWNSKSEQQTLDVKNILPNNGMYILQAQNEDGIYNSKKFIYTR